MKVFVFLKIPKLEDKLCDGVHIAMTYTALATLVILGKDILYISRFEWFSDMEWWEVKNRPRIQPNYVNKIKNKSMIYAS